MEVKFEPRLSIEALCPVEGEIGSPETCLSTFLTFLASEACLQILGLWKAHFTNTCRKSSAGVLSPVTHAISQDHSLFCWELGERDMWKVCLPPETMNEWSEILGRVLSLYQHSQRLSLEESPTFSCKSIPHTSQATPSVWIWLWLTLNGLYLSLVHHLLPLPILILCIPPINIQGPSTVH